MHELFYACVMNAPCSGIFSSRYVVTIGPKNSQHGSILQRLETMAKITYLKKILLSRLDFLPVAGGSPAAAAPGAAGPPAPSTGGNAPPAAPPVSSAAQ